MEIEKQKPAWLDESHPNYIRWKRARDLSIARGEFVKSIINQKTKTKNLTLLDLGSGEGGTVNVFSDNNLVVSFDISLIRLERQKMFVNPADDSDLKNVTHSNIKHVNGSAIQLPFKNNSFDLIIIQDVIEHLTGTNYFYAEINRILKPKGVIYLSTPNKLSVFNFISDPHFGLPFLSLLTRETIKKYFLKIFRKNDYNRKDVAQLLSLNELNNIFKNEFEISIYTKFSVRELFSGNKGIVWSNFHLKLISICRLIKADSLIIKIANDKFSFINKYFTPTFYLILIKKSYNHKSENFVNN